MSVTEINNDWINPLTRQILMMGVLMGAGGNEHFTPILGNRNKQKKDLGTLLRLV
jgi:hypothetical protein